MRLQRTMLGPVRFVPLGGAAAWGTPYTNGSGSPGTTVRPPTTTTKPSPTTTVPHDKTATTSQGGTVWTYCSGEDHIVFVSAVPKSGFERTRDVESPSGIVQTFESDSHRSTISARYEFGVP